MRNRFWIAWAPLSMVGIASLATQVRAMPHFARQYDMRCSMCHLVPPKLNETGLEFQANGFRLPGLDPPNGDTTALSVLLQGRYEDQIGRGWDDAYFRELEIIGAGPIDDRGGSFFVEWLPFNNQRRSDGSARVRNSRFEDIYVSVPVCAKGNGALTVGQYRGGSQVDVSHRLSISTPLAFSAPVGQFSVGGRSPSIGFSLFQPDSPDDLVDGWTHGVVIPFPGELAIRDDFHLESEPQGVFLESYHREGLDSYGCYTFFGEGQTLLGGIGVWNRGDNFATLNVGWATGDDDLRLSVEDEYLFSEHLAIGARYEHQGGSADRDAGVFFINFDMPTSTWTTRWRAEYRSETGRDEFVVQAEALF